MAKVYISHPSEAPEGSRVEQGPQGGLYYESEGREASEAIASLVGLAWKRPDGSVLSVVDQTGETLVVMDESGSIIQMDRAAALRSAVDGQIVSPPDSANDPAEDFVGEEWMYQGERYVVEEYLGSDRYRVRNVDTGAETTESLNTVEEMIYGPDSQDDFDGDEVPDDLEGARVRVGNRTYQVVDVEGGKVLLSGVDGDHQVRESDLREKLASGKYGLIRQKTFESPRDFVNTAKPGDIADMYIVPGYEIHATIVDRSPSYIKAEMMISDEQTGDYLGQMIRVFHADGTVEHDIFVLEPEAQGDGVAAVINEHVEGEYRRMGFTRVDLFADIDVGKYTWALQGYDFASPSDADDMLSRLKRFLTSKPRDGEVLTDGRRSIKIVEFQPAVKKDWMTEDDLRGKSQYLVETEDGHTMLVGASYIDGLMRKRAETSVERLVASAGGLKHSWDFAALDDGNQYGWVTEAKTGRGHLGKAFMLSSYSRGWDGTKSLDPSSPAAAIARRYYETKGKKGKGRRDTK